ncbi:MAG TPA: hypothetical protein VK988_21500 [Acidimicrobiales bacterium]|nr:hypothetical protein [Acidimicrobiales bacterium]
MKIATGVWAYKPGAAKRKSIELFEKIGVSKLGQIVIQDEDGNLYLAEPI